MKVRISAKQLEFHLFQCHINTKFNKTEISTKKERREIKNQIFIYRVFTLRIK